MAAAEKLYSPQVLALSASLPQWPFDPALPLVGHARSKSCGSTLDLALRLDAEGAIEQVGLRVRACAIGQAASALFAAAAVSKSRADIVRAEQAVAAWLEGAAALPAWPGFAAIERAQAYPARHGAILLPWRAALDALPTG